LPVPESQNCPVGQTTPAQATTKQPAMQAPSTQVSLAGHVTSRQGSASDTQVARQTGPSGGAASATSVLPAAPAPTGGGSLAGTELPPAPVLTTGGVGALASGAADSPVATWQPMTADTRSVMASSLAVPASLRHCRRSEFDMDAVVPTTSHFRLAR
jgi:hypothetical protein